MLLHKKPDGTLDRCKARKHCKWGVVAQTITVDRLGKKKARMIPGLTIATTGKTSWAWTRVERKANSLKSCNVYEPPLAKDALVNALIARAFIEGQVSALKYSGVDSATIEAFRALLKSLGE